MLVSPSRAHHNAAQCAVTSRPSRRPTAASSVLVGPLTWQRATLLQVLLQTGRGTPSLPWRPGCVRMAPRAGQPQPLASVAKHADQTTNWPRAASLQPPRSLSPLAALRSRSTQPPCGDAQRSSAHRRLAEMQEKFVLSCKRGAPGPPNAARRVEIHIKNECICKFSTQRL